jgi:3',5'-cyclic-AMP phosphodiesterase
MLLVAQITDTHLFADDRATLFNCPTNQTFAAVMTAIGELQPRPDILLLTGDISQDETRESYEYARSLIQPLGIPTYWIPGNHDQNIATIAALNDGCISSLKAFSQAGWQFILLDSMVLQHPWGELSKSQLELLENHLQSSLPTLIAVHHHTIDCGLGYMDNIGLRNAEAFFAVIDRYPQVKVVVNGHIHQEFATQRLGVHYLGTPSTCMQLKPRQAEVEVSDRPPAFRLIRFESDGRIETEVCWVNVQ